MPVFELKQVNGNVTKTEINSQNVSVQQPELPKCPNCNSVLSCGCQRRTARDGKEVCEDCLESYENSIGQ
jgi:hypothetical protein